MTDLTLCKLKSLILPHQTPMLTPQFPQCLGMFHELLSTFPCCHLLTPFYFGFCTLKMISSATPSTALAICWTSAWLVCVAAVSTATLCHFSDCAVYGNPSGPGQHFLTGAFIFLIVVSSLLTSVIISSLFMPYMNHSFILLSFSLQLHSFAFILQHPVNPFFSIFVWIFCEPAILQ